MFSSKRCATRSFALRERGFRFISSGDGRIGFRVRTFNTGLFPQTQIGKSGGQVQPVDIFLNRSLTIRSSSEW